MIDSHIKLLYEVKHNILKLYKKKFVRKKKIGEGFQSSELPM